LSILITELQVHRMWTSSNFTYIIDGIDICFGKDKFLEGSTVSVPGSLVYCCVTMLHSYNTITLLLKTTNCGD